MSAARRSPVARADSEGLLYDKPYRARTTIHRSPDQLDASVVISAFGDPTEWLAHDLEHVLEQVDGIDLSRLVIGHHDTWPSSGYAFETGRAIRAGEAVLQEVRDSIRGLPRLKPAEPGRGDD